MADHKTTDGVTLQPAQVPKLRDELLYCDHCGISFLWSSEEQKSWHSATQPNYCRACQHLRPNERRERGLVKWFNARKYFGFIVRRNAEEIFAPAAEVKNRIRLKEGDLVEFTVGANERGPIAQDIQILQSPNG